MKNFPFDKFRRDVEDALYGVAQQYGLELTVGKIRFGSANFVAKLEAAAIIGGVAETPEREAFKAIAYSKGLHPGLLDFAFTDDEGRRYRISGWNRRAKSLPVKLVALDGGRNAKAPVDWLLPYVKEAMEKLGQGLTIQQINEGQ